MAGLKVSIGALWLLSMAARADNENFRFWAGEIPPYAYLDADQTPKGVVLQVFQTLVERMGHKEKVEVVPWKRVLIEAQKNHPIFFIPAARSPDREKIYKWIAPILQESFGIFSLPGREREMQDLERVRKLHICTLRGSATEELARRHRLTHLELVGTNDICARLVKAGRVDAWLVARRAALASFVQVGYSLKDLSSGISLEQWPLYLAASKSISDAELQRWRTELQKMKDDGTLDRLLN